MKANKLTACASLISLLLVGGLVNAQVVAAKKTETPRDEKELNIICQTAKPPHRALRYSTVRELLKETYVNWMMSKGSILSEAGKHFTQPEGSDILEVLVVFSNKSDRDSKIEIKDMHLEAQGKNYGYWEVLPGNIYGDYEYMAQRLGLSQTKPDGDFFVNVEFKGNMDSTLKPGEKAWLALMFFVPKGTQDARLILEIPEERTVTMHLK